MEIRKDHDDFDEVVTWEEGSEEWEREREQRTYEEYVDDVLHDPDWDREKCGWSRVTGIRPEQQ